MFEGDVRITFDGPTNSLLIMSSFKDFQALRRVIEKLDAPRKQIFIEAYILEVTTDKNRTVGVSYHAGAPESIAGMRQVIEAYTPAASGRFVDYRGNEAPW